MQIMEYGSLPLLLTYSRKLKLLKEEVECFAQHRIGASELVVQVQSGRAQCGRLRRAFAEEDVQREHV